MAKRKKRKNVQVGDIVQVIDSSFGPAFECAGQVAEVGPPIKVAVVLMLSLERGQLETALSGKALRKFAKKIHLPDKGKRPELEAKIKAQILELWRCELSSPADDSAAPSAMEDSYAVPSPITMPSAAPMPMAEESMASHPFEYGDARVSARGVSEDVAVPATPRGMAASPIFQNGWIVEVVDKADKYYGASGPVTDNGPDPVTVVLTPCPQTGNKTLRNQKYQEHQLKKSS